MTISPRKTQWEPALFESVSWTMCGSICGATFAIGRGELSYSKVRALTRVATPEAEDVLLNVVLHGTAHHVESLVRQFRRVQEVDELSRGRATRNSDAG